MLCDEEMEMRLSQPINKNSSLNQSSIGLRLDRSKLGYSKKIKRKEIKVKEEPVMHEKSR